MAAPYDVRRFAYGFDHFIPVDVVDAGITGLYPGAELRFPSGSHIPLTDGRVLHCANIATQPGYRFADAVVLVEADSVGTYTTVGATDGARLVAFHNGSHASSGTPGGDFAPSVVGHLSRGPDGALWLGLAATAGGSLSFGGTITASLNPTAESLNAYLRSTDEGATWTEHTPPFAAFETRVFSPPTYPPAIEFSNTEVYTEGGASRPLTPLGRPVVDASGAWWAPGPFYDDGGLFASRARRSSIFRSVEIPANPPLQPLPIPVGVIWAATGFNLIKPDPDLEITYPNRETTAHCPEAVALFNGRVYWMNTTRFSLGGKTALFEQFSDELFKIDEASVGAPGNIDARGILGSFEDGGLWAIRSDDIYGHGTGDGTPSLASLSDVSLLDLPNDIGSGTYLASNFGPGNSSIIVQGMPRAWQIADASGWGINTVRMA